MEEKLSLQHVLWPLGIIYVLYKWQSLSQKNMASIARRRASEGKAKILTAPPHTVGRATVKSALRVPHIQPTLVYNIVIAGSQESSGSIQAGLSTSTVVHDILMYMVHIRAM